MTAGQVASLPEHLAGFRVETRCAEAAEVDIDPAGLNHGRGGRITIHRCSIAERLGVIAMKYFFVEPNLSSVGVQTDGKEIVAVLRRCGHPDLASHHNRRGPASMWERDLPFDVVRLAPVKWQTHGPGVTRRRDMAIAPRPAELWPVRSDFARAKGE